MAGKLFVEEFSFDVHTLSVPTLRYFGYTEIANDKEVELAVDSLYPYVDIRDGEVMTAAFEAVDAVIARARKNNS